MLYRRKGIRIKKYRLINKKLPGIFKMKGSYAVEAVFVVPVILGMVFAMIYVMYYLHDRTVMYSNMQKAVVAVAEGRKEYKNNEEWQQEMQENLWIFNVKSGSISQNKLYTESYVTAECNLDIPVIRYFMDSKQEISAKDKYLTIHPEFMIRAEGIFSDKNGG